MSRGFLPAPPPQCHTEALSRFREAGIDVTSQYIHNHIVIRHDSERLTFGWSSTSNSLRWFRSPHKCVQNARGVTIDKLIAAVRACQC